MKYEFLFFIYMLSKYSSIVFAVVVMKYFSKNQKIRQKL